MDNFTSRYTARVAIIKNGKLEYKLEPCSNLATKELLEKNNWLVEKAVKMYQAK